MILAAAAESSVVTIDKVPLVPAVNTAVSLVEPVMVTTLPFITTSSTVNVVKVPKEVMFVWAAVVTVAAVPEVLPVTLPTTFPVKPDEVIVPNEEPASANVIVPPSASNVIPPPESKVTVVPASSAVPSAVIWMLAAAAAVSVVVISKVPLVPAVNTAVSPLEPVMVTTLPFIATSSTVNSLIALLESTTIAFEATTVPAVIPSIVSNSASLITALPIVNPVPVTTPVEVIAPEPIVPAAVTFAPLKVSAVVVPDLTIKLPDVFVALPKVVPASLKNTSPPSASSIISAEPFMVKSPVDVISVVVNVPIVVPLPILP